MSSGALIYSFRKKEIIITCGRNKDEIIIISGLPRVWTGLRVTRQIMQDSKFSHEHVYVFSYKLMGDTARVV